MFRFIILAVFGVIIVACGSSTEQSAEPVVQTPAAPDVTPDSVISEAKFREGMAIDVSYAVSYENEGGTSIPFEEFINAASSGRSFSKTVRPEDSTASFSINPISLDKKLSTGTPRHGLKVPLASLMPAISEIDLDGKVHSIGDGTNYTLLSFFFSDCVPCIQEVPELNELARLRPGLNILAITFDSKSEASAFVGKFGLNVPVIAGAQEYIDSLGVRVYPTLILVSPDGRLVATNSSRETSGGSTPIGDWLNGLGV